MSDMKRILPRQEVQDNICETLGLIDPDNLAELANSLCTTQVRVAELPVVPGHFETIGTITPTKSCEREFPGFRLGKAVIPANWIDTSNHADGCPHWGVPNTGLEVWMGGGRPEAAVSLAYRYWVYLERLDGRSSVSLKTNDWKEVLWYVKAYQEEMQRLYYMVTYANYTTKATPVLLLVSDEEPSDDELRKKALKHAPKGCTVMKIEKVAKQL